MVQALDFLSTTRADGRPQRRRIAPLQHWRNESVVYERCQGDLSVATVQRSSTEQSPQSSANVQHQQSKLAELQAAKRRKLVQLPEAELSRKQQGPLHHDELQEEAEEPEEPMRLPVRRRRGRLARCFNERRDRQAVAQEPLMVPVPKPPAGSAPICRRLWPEERAKKSSPEAMLPMPTQMCTFCIALLVLGHPLVVGTSVFLVVRAIGQTLNKA